MNSLKNIELTFIDYFLQSKIGYKNKYDHLLIVKALFKVFNKRLKE